MNLTESLSTLDTWDRKGRYVFTKGDLAKLFAESDNTLSRTLERLTAKGLLVRACRGVYVFGLSRNIGGFTLEEIALAIRREDYNFLSLESALSEWGSISQVPVDRITVMTTGRKGEFKTPYGVIEFTHTELGAKEILANTVSQDARPLRIATEAFALKNQNRVGRNRFLIEENA